MISIGNNIRYYRRLINITAKEMAERMGVSPSTISKIENDKISPSMEMLQKISEVLNIPVGQIFIERENDFEQTPHNDSPAKIVRKNRRNKIILHNSDVEFEMLSRSFNGRSEMAIMELKPGQGSGAPKRHPIGEEFIYVLKGCLYFNVNGEEINLEQGDSMTLDATVSHFYKNISQEKTVIISGNTPPVW